MTREEAIRHIEAAKLMLLGNDNQPISDLYYALDMAIKALEQEPCEDAISRKEVLDYLNKMPSELTSDGRRMVRRRTLEEYISDTLPPVNPQPKKEHWIPVKSRIGIMPEQYECSECGRNILLDAYKEETLKEDYPYCHCGAKMQ